jgi:predicted ABC-type ATPase
LVVVAGPNGAGKTTFAREYLKAHPCSYISADVLAEAMGSDSIEKVRLKAGRAFALEVRAQMERNETFLVESTLAGLTFRRSIEAARAVGYEVVVIFVFLGSAEACVARIRERVRKGGHAVREDDVRRRFRRSIQGFWGSYRALADRWHLFYNGGAQFHEVAVGEGPAVEVRDESLFAAFLAIAERADK